MKKLALTLTALSMSVAVSACTHDNGPRNNANMQQDGYHHDWDHKEWDHKEHMRMMTEDFFNRMDKNGDGVVTRKEYVAFTREWFKQADTNHDGKLTMDEVSAQLKRDKENMKARHHMDHNAMQHDSMDNSLQEQAPVSDGMTRDNAETGANNVTPTYNDSYSNHSYNTPMNRQ